MIENMRLKFLFAHLRTALLYWFIAISISLIIGIIFLTDSFRNEVPIVLLNLWFITLFTLPVYTVISLITKKFVFISYVVMLLVLLSFANYNGKFLPEPGVFSFPKIQTLIFINSDSEREMIPEDNIHEIDEGKETEQELPNEL